MFAAARQDVGPEPGGDLLREQAEALTWSGRWEEALEPASTELGLRPDSAWALAYKGRILSWKGEWSRALPLLRKALESNPLQVEAVEALSELNDWRDRPGAALRVLRDYATRSGEALPAALSAKAEHLQRTHPPSATLWVSQLDDSRKVQLAEQGLGLRMPIAMRSGRLELQADVGRFSFQDPVKPADLPVAGRARAARMTGSTLRAHSLWRWNGRFAAELGATRFDVGEGTVLGGQASVSWRLPGKADTTLEGKWRVSPESFTTPAILGALRRSSAGGSALISGIPRTTLRLDVEALDWSDGNHGLQRSAWGLVELLSGSTRSLQVGMAASRLDVQEHRYPLRSATSTRDPLSGLHHYELEGEFAYWSPLRQDRLQLLLKTSHRFGTKFTASASVSWTVEDLTVMPFLGPEWGVAPMPDPDLLEIGSYELHDERPLEIRASLNWAGESGWEIGLALDHVESIFYDYDTVSLQLGFQSRQRSGS